MNVAIAYHTVDEGQFHRWLAWAVALGVGERHALTVLPFKGLVPPAIKGWASVEILKDGEGMKGDWTSGAVIRDAAAPNSMFRELARHFLMKNAGPWLFMEPDAVFLRKEAIDMLEAEYSASGKRIMASAVTREDTPRHPSGIAVYPGNLAAVAGNYMRPRMMPTGKGYVEAGFNLAGAPDAFASFHDTALIQQVFRHPGFKTREEMLATVSPHAVVFHSDKHHSLIRLLRPGAGEGDAAKSAPQGVRSPPSFTPRHPAAESRLVTPREAALTVEVESLKEKVKQLIGIIDGYAAKLAESKPRKRRMSKSPKKRTPAEQAKINARMAKARAARKK